MVKGKEEEEEEEEEGGREFLERPVYQPGAGTEVDGRDKQADTNFLLLFHSKPQVCTISCPHSTICTFFCRPHLTPFLDMTLSHFLRP